MAGGNLYTPEEDALILAAYDGRIAGQRDGALLELSQRLGRAMMSIRHRYNTLKAKAGGITPGVTLSRSVRQQVGVEVLAPLETDLEPENSFLSRVLQKTGGSVEHHKAERYARVRIESDLPIAISMSSDWHLTSTGATDVQGLLDYADAIGFADRAFAVAVGDQIDNPIKHQPAATRDVPDDLRLLDILLGRFQGKMLGMTSGNHDDWTRTIVGVDNIKTMGERHAIHYAPDELVWLVEIVSPSDPETVTARWIIATRHKYFRHSNLNPVHACWRWLETGNWPHDGKGASYLPDVLAIGHNHCAEVGIKTLERGTVIGCRMGSWQYTSGFTRAGGWTLQPPTAPTVILPNIRDGSEQPVAYADYRTALAALRVK